MSEWGPLVIRASPLCHLTGSSGISAVACSSGCHDYHCRVWAAASLFTGTNLSIRSYDPLSSVRLLGRPSALVQQIRPYLITNEVAGEIPIVGAAIHPPGFDEIPEEPLFWEQ